MLEEQSLKYLNVWGVWERINSWKHRATLTKVCDVNENKAEHSAALSPLTGAPKQLDTPTAAATTNICPAAASCEGNTGFQIPPSVLSTWWNQYFRGYDLLHPLGGVLTPDPNTKTHPSTTVRGQVGDFVGMLQSFDLSSGLTSHPFNLLISD